MSLQFQQSVAATIPILLTKNNVPVTGLVFSDVFADFRKNGASFLGAKSVTALNFAEINNGLYTLTFTATELNTVGPLVIIVQGALIDQSTTIIQIYATGSQPSTAVLMDTCILTGHVADALGTPKANVAVSAQVIGMPSIEQSAAALTDDLVSVKTDVNGEFFLELVRLADVEIFIPAVNYRRRLVVPNAASANLFTGVP